MLEQASHFVASVVPANHRERVSRPVPTVQQENSPKKAGQCAQIVSLGSIQHLAKKNAFSVRLVNFLGKTTQHAQTARQGNSQAISGLLLAPLVIVARFQKLVRLHAQTVNQASMLNTRDRQNAPTALQGRLQPMLDYMPVLNAPLDFSLLMQAKQHVVLVQQVNMVRHMVSRNVNNVPRVHIRLLGWLSAQTALLEISQIVLVQQNATPVQQGNIQAKQQQHAQTVGRASFRSRMQTSAATVLRGHNKMPQANPVARTVLRESMQQPRVWYNVLTVQ
jgi:hypothetical protein